MAEKKKLEMPTAPPSHGRTGPSERKVSRPEDESLPSSIPAAAHGHSDSPHAGLSETQQTTGSAPYGKSGSPEHHRNDHQASQSPAAKEVSPHFPEESIRSSPSPDGSAVVPKREGIPGAFFPIMVGAVLVLALLLTLYQATLEPTGTSAVVPLPPDSSGFTPFVSSSEPSARQAVADMEGTEIVQPDLKATKESVVATLPGSFPDNEPRHTQATWHVEIAPGVLMQFCWCPPGEFLMGSETTEPERNADEFAHSVRFSLGFWMAKFEVTQEQYLAVIGRNPSSFRGSERLPVEKVSWSDAQLFLSKVNEWASPRLGADRGFTLPSEAQWEYACKAGVSGSYPSWGLEESAWYDSNSAGKPREVGLKRPNGWGLHDMQGNVWEWCKDWYGAYPHSGELVIDPQGPGKGDYRVVRGGGWHGVDRFCRPAFRSGNVSGGRFYDVGFRPVIARKRLENDNSDAALASSRSSEGSSLIRKQAGIRRGLHGMTFVPVKAGMFMMGSPENENGRGVNELQHHVTLTREFEMAETEVTQGQWLAVMGGENPSHFKESGPEAPVENVSWQDAVNFCARLTEMDREGWMYRLPTEAEWEYACRAGTVSPFSFGAALNGRQANCEGNLPYGTEEKGPNLQKTSLVKSYSANPWGLFDLHGNVREWCWDRYGAYPADGISDPQGPSTGDNRVLRGGSWGSEAQSCRSSSRGVYYPGNRLSTIGFRPIRQK